jgi:predicted dinucleotide-binding enzyme
LVSWFLPDPLVSASTPWFLPRPLGFCLGFWRVVAAFGNVPSEVLFGVFDARRRKAKRPSLVYCGDDPDANEVAAGLIRDVGFDPVDLGPLRTARYTEPFALLVGQLAIAYKVQSILTRSDIAVL